MDLNVFGVETASIPAIHAVIDLKNQASTCRKLFDDPKYKNSTYSLTAVELKKIEKLLNTSEFKNLKKKYQVSSTDQPTSTIKIYNDNKLVVIQDYGLKGEYPLPELYKIVYKLDF